eukprot:gene23886-28927_t
MEHKTWMCLICGWIYDEAEGDPEHGIAPGTKWEDVPMNWTCPECAARKEDFEMVNKLRSWIATSQAPRNDGNSQRLLFRLKVAPRNDCHPSSRAKRGDPVCEQALQQDCHVASSSQ